ncbi:hypothetical protein [Actinoplanes sp. NPDC048796]|uniref:hypothetical protein n=1 Tax=unclassified Actinoplanes TaxID=2626549 RepID=UPI0033C7638D
MPLVAVTGTSGLVGAAVARAAVTAEATGIFVVAGRHPFRRTGCGALLDDAAGLIAARAPEVAAAFAERGWPLPRTLDRVYGSSAATAALRLSAHAVSA